LRSLERRLQLGLGVSLVLLLGLLWWSGALAVRQLTEQFVLSRLEHDAEQVLAAYAMAGRVAGGAAGDGLAPGRIPPVYRKPFSGHYYLVRLPDGTEDRSRSLWDQDIDVPEMEPGGQTSFRAAGPLGQRLLVLAAGFERDGRRLTVAVAEDLTPIERDIAQFGWVMAGLLLVFVAVLLLVQRLILRASFRRLEPVRDDIRRLAEGDIGTVRDDVPSEVRPLVRELNRLLELLTRRLEHSRHALGNLAHALKGPLSLLTQGLEDRERSVDREALASQAERIRALIERELRRARVAGVGQAGQLFHPARDVPDLIDAVRHMHTGRQLSIAFDDRTGGALRLDREDMLELIGNLLDNACKWGRGAVALRIERAGGAVELKVEDDGPGVSDALIEQLTLRGVRADESVSGHGLGLAIAKDIVKLYGGSLSFGRSEALGGLAVVVDLPREQGANLP
jgi:signal transduction histidine kinase